MADLLVRAMRDLSSREGLIRWIDELDGELRRMRRQRAKLVVLVVLSVAWALFGRVN